MAKKKEQRFLIPVPGNGKGKIYASMNHIVNFHHWRIERAGAALDHTHITFPSKSTVYPTAFARQSTLAIAVEDAGSHRMAEDQSVTRLLYGIYAETVAQKTF